MIFYYVASDKKNCILFLLFFAYYRINPDSPDSAYIESYINPAIPPYIEINMKEGGLPVRDKNFENDLNSRDSPKKVPNGLPPEDKDSTK